MVAFPTSPATRLSNEEFTFALRRRLGLGFGTEAGCCEGCGHPLDLHGHHRVACNRTGRLHGRHRSLVAAWRQVFQEAGKLEPRLNVFV